MENLGLTRIRALLASEVKAHITDLIQQDLAIEKESAQIASLEKLILFQRDLVKLLNNFVSFAEFYGRKGVFYDRKGCDWDATITKIVANPISIREAFWAPYKKLVRMIEEQVAKRAAAADAAANTKLSGAAQTVAEADKAKPAAAKPPEAKRMDIGTVAAIGVALGSISTVLAMLLGVWIPLGILALSVQATCIKALRMIQIGSSGCVGPGPACRVPQCEDGGPGTAHRA